MPLPRTTLLLPLLAAALSGCSSGGHARTAAGANEAFDSANTYSRSFDHSPAQACEAARRALLSQGFVVGHAGAEVVEARKYFQRDEDHQQVEFRAVCMPQTRGEQQTVVFVNAVQDRYALRKRNNNASLGVSALGSVSLPIGSSEDSLVKVASETLQDPTFYKRFYSVLERFLPEQVERPAEPQAQQPVLFPVPRYQLPPPASELPPAGRPAQPPVTVEPAVPARPAITPHSPAGR